MVGKVKRQIHKFFKLLAVLGALATPAMALAQTAVILPNARTQFINANGQPVVGGTVSFYVPSTLTPKTTWQDSGETTPNINPITLDALGSGLIWGSGSYREILKDASGNVIWDALTLGNASSGIGSANGILQANGSGVVTAVTIGAGLTYGGGTLSATGGGAGGLSTVFDVDKSYGGDPTGATDNTSAYNNAKAACVVANGGIIFFGAGTHKFTSRITDAAPNCSIQGAGQSATILSPTGIAGDFLTVTSTGVQGVFLSDLHITNGGAWTIGYAVNWQSAEGKIHDVWIDLAPQAIRSTNTIDTKIDHVRANDLTSSPFFSCDNSTGDVFGIHYDLVTAGAFSSNTTATGFHQGAGCNSYIISNSGVVTLNVCLDNTTDSGSFTTLYDFECDHSQNGVIFNGGDGIQISNSWFGSTLLGNGLTFASTFSRYATVTGSQIRTNTQTGLLINGSGGVSVTGNVISGNASFNVAVGSNVTNFNIVGNQIGVITSVGDPTSPYCVYVNTGTSNYYNISQNVCGSNNTNGVIDGGSGVKKFVSGNVGP